jgi:hypothetical protein
VTALAITPIDESGRNAPSEPKVNPPSPSNEAGETSPIQGTSGTSGTSATSGTATGTSDPSTSDEVAKARGRSGSGPAGGQIDTGSSPQK